MKIGNDVYCICDKCKKLIKKGDDYILCTSRIAGQHGASRISDLCIECYDTIKEKK
jgi:hypothetical protein